MKQTIINICVALLILCVGCGDVQQPTQNAKNDVQNNNTQKFTVEQNHYQLLSDDENSKNFKIPNKWNIKDKLDSFPLIDFRKIKSINNAAISDEEKQKEKAAKAIYDDLVKAIQSKNLSKALSLRNKLEKEYHDNMSAIDGAYQYAQYFESSNKNKAIQEYEWILVTWPESYRKWDAVYRLQSLQNMYMYLYAYGNYHNTDSTKISFQLSGTNLKNVQAIVYKVDLVKMVEEGLNPQAPSIPEHAKEASKWQVELANNGNNWTYHQLTMPKLGAGHYILSVKSNYITINSLFSTSDISLLTKSDDRMLLCWAKDQKKRSLASSKVLVLKAGKIVYRSNTNDSGLFAAQMKMRENDSDNLHVIVDTPYGQAVSGSYYYWYSGYYRRIQYAYTDRPIYRPGQKVNFKGIFRERKQDESIVATKGDIGLIIYNQQWEKIEEKTFTMDEFGSIVGEYNIPKDAKLGQYYMYFNGSGYYSNANFQVEEYKKPEYEVFVTTETSNVLQTEKINAVVEAKYYFGEPVKDAEVEYEVYETIHWHDPYYYDRWGWFHDSNEYYYRWNPYGNEQLIHQGKAKLDSEGKANIAITTRQNKDYDLRYRVRASVIDKSRRKIDGSGTFLATRSSFNIAIKTDRWSYRPGETIKLEVLTQDYNQKPVSTDIILKTSKSLSDGKTQEMFSQSLTTDDNGRATYDWKADQNGYMYFYAEAKDKNGKIVSVGKNVWVADNSWRSPYSYSGLSLELEKSTYTPGEEIRGIITTGYSDSYMLTTTETDRLQAYDLVKMQSGVYTYNNTALEEYEPYVDIHVTMMEENTLVQATKKVIVPPTKAFLNVAVARDATYQPGQKAEYTIKITDSENNPVVAQFSFGLVDEAIYSMRADNTVDIRKAFYMGYRGNVHTNSSYYFYSLGYGDKKGTKTGEDTALGGAKSESKKRDSNESVANGKAVALAESADTPMRGKLGQQQQLQQPRVRTEFADSAVWEPNVVTNKNGIAKVKFTMPDNLTTWRATIRGVTMSGKVGETVDKVITRKNLMARLECPRTLTEQDEATISGVIHNYLANEVNSVCRLKITGAELLDEKEQNIILVPGEDKRVDWRIRVTSLEKVVLELEALTTQESDAMRLTLPVVPYGVAIRKSDSGVTDTSSTFSFMLPTSSSEDRAKLIVSVKPTLAGSMLESLEYLAGYPYGCVEQTMSRFLPSAIVAQTLQNLQMRHEKLEAELPKYLEVGTTRLYDFQNGDGGWGWWQNDQSNPLMTAYVMYGFAQAQKADFKVKADVMSRGMDALKNLINKEQNFESKCYMVFAYSEVKKPEQKWVNDLYAKVDEMSDYCRALLLIMVKKSNSMDIAQDLLKMLEKNAQVDGGYCHFSGKTVRYGWTDNPIETTAYCLKAIVAMNPQHALIAKILKWLEIKKQGKHYQSTKDTAAVVFAFSDYLVHSNELNPNYTGSVTINGVSHAISFNGSTASTEIKEFTVIPQLGSNTITVEKKGVGKLYYTAYLEYYSKEKEIPASSSGLSVERKYFKLQQKKDENGVITHERMPMGETIQQGEVFEVELTFSTPRSYEYLMLEDYIPAGCEFEKDTTKSQYNSRYYYWSWSNKEFRDDRLVIFFSYYNGENKIVYRLRAETPGTFYAMPARAEMMYFPEMRCNTTQKKLIIIEKTR